jgi:hypothetical protein
VRFVNWSHFMQLWHKIHVTPINIVICEKGFCKQNAFKNHLQTSLKLNTMDALMKVSLCNIKMDNCTKGVFDE